MTVQNLPKKGDKLFLMHREIVVTKVYAVFRFVKIQYTGENFQFFVDASALTIVPVYSNSISIGTLRRNCNE